MTQNIKKNNIEVEVKCLLDEPSYKRLLRFFRRHSKFLYEEKQENIYYGSQDESSLRLRTDYRSCYLIFKKGAMHDEKREEYEVRCDAKDYKILQKIIGNLGFEIDTIWQRTRQAFIWDDYNVFLDNNVGYGYVLELEELVPFKKKDVILNKIKDKVAELKIEVTPPEIWDKMYLYYKKNWRNILASKGIFTLKQAMDGCG